VNVVQEPQDRYAKRVQVGIQLGSNTPISVMLDSGSSGLLVDSSATVGLPPDNLVCSPSCTNSYSSGLIFTYTAVKAQVTISGNGPGSATTAGMIDIGSINAVTCAAGRTCGCVPSLTQCENDQFGPGVGIMGIAISGNSLTAPTRPIQSPLVQLQPTSFLYNGYALSLNPPELVPPTSTPSTVSLPLIATTRTYPDNRTQYFTAVDLCWTVAAIGPVCGVNSGTNSSSLTLIDSGEPQPTVPQNSPFSSLINQQVSISPPGAQPLWSFTSRTSPPAPRQYNLMQALAPPGNVIAFNASIGFLFQNEVGYNLQTGTALITPTPPDPPIATISAPRGDSVYNLNQSVSTAFACRDGKGGPGVLACTDSNGARSPGGRLSTTRAGTFKYSVTASSYDGLTAGTTVNYRVRPTNKFTVTHIKASPTGVVRFAIALPGPGTVNVLETAWKDNRAFGATSSAGEFVGRELTVKHRAQSAPVLQPARGRFVFARKRLSVKRKETVQVRVDPNKIGRKLVRHHTYGVTIRLWVTFTPVGGKTASVGYYGLKITP
jgi:hypothetical protein